MIFLKNFKLLSEKEEGFILQDDPRRIYNSYYPLGIFTRKDLREIEFDNITIFYGGNGSGKTTLLNLIADKVEATRKNIVDKGNLFKLYGKNCKEEWKSMKYDYVKMISSDDVFDYLLDIRAINSNVSRRKEDLSQEWVENKYSRYNGFSSLDSYEDLKRMTDARKQTMSSYGRGRLSNNTIVEHSNGESALMFWEKEILDNGLYILDEPENSLSAENQIKLKKFIEESVRFFNCQFIISTHSPFLLGLDYAKIYNLDMVPARVCKWSELENVLTYYNFFKEREEDFE